MTASTKPYAVTINEHSSTAFAQAAALIRQGYVFTEAPPVIYEINGQASINLVLGAPTPYAIKAAEATIKLYTDLAEAADQRQVEAAARLTAEAVEKQQKKAALDAQIDEQTKALRKLRDQAAKLK
ncbi:hypothetical protein [Rugamonas aquatica]|uniref:Uncharacterized protein n=1 Tax=Rugamonas aquatica TaxID=2743357 RepID=A0A6A7N3L9_9BURK|nr:hypothetical protein [Rugamonas aquatica]MQA39625.1 hypothetical protein [Rugamonas aquatica]